MTDVPTLLPPAQRAAQRPIRTRLLQRASLYLLFAAIEGLAAFALVFLVAWIYHATFLRVPFEDFETGRYLGYAGLAALFYGASAGFGCERFLEGKQGYQYTVPDSFFGWTGTFAFTLLAAFLTGQIGDLSRASLTMAYLIGIPLMFALRAYAQVQLAKRIHKGALHYEKVSVVGKRTDVVNFLLNGELWRNGQRLTSTLYLEDAADARGGVRSDAIEEFARQSARDGADFIILIGDLTDIDALEAMLMQMKRFALNIAYAPATSNTSFKFLDVVAIGPNNALRFVRKPLSDVSVFLKRSMDVVLAAFGLVVLSPLFALVAAAIVLDTPGPIIYRQARRGFNGESFMIWKFRSMTVTESGLAMRQATVNDARITRVGKFLRETSIDELPQLVNVLRGQMSIVGPRPHAISHDDELGRQMATYAHRQRIKPGITGWAQANGHRGETSDFKDIEARIIHDIYYIDNWSIFLDVLILVLTFLSPAARRNAR